MSPGRPPCIGSLHRRALRKRARNHTELAGRPSPSASCTPSQAHLRRLRRCRLRPRLVRVGAHLVVDRLRAHRADGPGDGVALLGVQHPLDLQLLAAALRLQGRRAHLGLLDHIGDGAVVLRVLVVPVSPVAAVLLR